MLPDEVLDHAELIIEGERIRAIHRHPTVSKPTIDWQHGWIWPGLLDIHIHGIAGADVMDGSLQAYRTIDQALLAVGCTNYVATTMTASQTELERVFGTLRSFRREPSGMLGVHMEGPYIHPDRIGAQRPDSVRLPDVDEMRSFYATLGSDLKRVTLAPEREGSQEFMAFCQSAGIDVSVGHSNATYEEARAAFEAGARQVTHLFNAMTPLHHRAPGIVGAAWLSDVYVELIADGIHLHPDVIRLTANIKGADRVVLVTDAMRATLLEDGTYELGGQNMTVAGGVARTRDGHLAGSTLTLIKAVFNYHRFTGRPLYEAVRAATLNPAEAIGDQERGALASGRYADIILVDEAGINRMTWRRGEVAYDGR